MGDKGVIKQEDSMFDPNKVSSFYSGRKGCACGCRGKYTYASKADQPSWMADDVSSPAGVRMMVRKVDRMVRDGFDVDKVHVSPDGDWVAVDMDHDRTYTVYFK